MSPRGMSQPDPMMQIAAPAPRVPPQWRIGAYYSTAFLSSGVATAFGGIWFAAQGIGAERIGVLNALPVLLLLVLNLWVGRIADRAADWRTVIVAGAMVAAVAPYALFVVSGFWGILAVWTCAAVSQSLIVPVTDAAAMRMSRRSGFDFPSLRAWGTVGYLTVILATGYLATWFGPGVFVPLLCAVVTLRALVALGLPRFRDPAGRRGASPGAGALLEVMRPWFVLPLVGWSIIFATHLILNAFQGLLWKQQGLPENVIGMLIALGALAETAMFFGYRRFSGRFSPRKLILASALVAVLRWIAFAFSPGVPLLVLLQLLHAVTYALGFVACISFITKWTSDDIAAETQSFFVVLQQGFSAIALTGFGGLAGRYGAQAYLASAVLAALGAGLIWLSLSLKQPGDAPGP